MRKNDEATTEEVQVQHQDDESSIPLEKDRIFELNHNGVTPITDQSN